MGVPVMTLQVETIPGRVGATGLHALGMQDWIAGDRKEYVARTVAKASDPVALAALRRGLRGRFEASVLGDHGFYVTAVERRYREVWRDWCRDG